MVAVPRTLEANHRVIVAKNANAIEADSDPRAKGTMPHHPRITRVAWHAPSPAFRYVLLAIS